MRNASVELMDVALKGCSSYALNITNTTSETTVVATRCEFANRLLIVNLVRYLVVVQHPLHLRIVYSTTTKMMELMLALLQYICTEKPLQYIEMEEMVYLHSGLVKFSFIFHLIIHNTFYNNGEEDRFTRQGSMITNVEDLKIIQ